MRFMALLAVLALSLLVMACGGAATESMSQDQPAAVAEDAQQVVEQAVEPAVDEETVTDVAPDTDEADVSDDDDAAVAEGESAKPTARAALEATAPDSVVLASGGPQLIEFFAYW